MSTIAINLRALRIQAGMSQLALAKASGLSQQLISQIERGENSSTKELPKLAKALGVTVDLIDPDYAVAAGEITDRVPLKGYIGAGAEVLALEDDGEDTAPAPADRRSTTVAVRVRGDSMFPAYEEGTLVYYSKIMPPEQLVNKRAVVQLADGRIFVKIVQPGSAANLWTLASLNPFYPPMPDQVVEWAAPIDWIRPL